MTAATARVTDLRSARNDATTPLLLEQTTIGHLSSAINVAEINVATPVVTSSVYATCVPLASTISSVHTSAMDCIASDATSWCPTHWDSVPSVNDIPVRAKAVTSIPRTITTTCLSYSRHAATCVMGGPRGTSGIGNLASVASGAEPCEIRATVRRPSLSPT